MAAASSFVWRRLNLEDIAERIDYGFTESASTDAVGPKFLRITDIQNGDVDWNTVPYCRATRDDIDIYKLTPGDIVFARTGATTGKSFLIQECPEDAIFASYLIRVRPKNSIDPRFLAHFFNTPDYWAQIRQQSVGSGQPGVNSSRLRSLSVPVPPFEEQQRIATILDRADTIRRKQREADALAGALSTSKFRDSFGHPDHGWQEQLMGDVAQVQGGIALSGRRDLLTRKVPYLRVANVFRDRLELSDIKEVGVTDEEFEKTSLRVGDVLLVEGHGNREEIGRSAIWDESIAGCVHQNHLIRVRPCLDRLHPVYLNAFVNSDDGRQQLFRFGKTTSGLNTINLSNVRSMQILLPPVDLQRRYAEFVGAQRTLTMRLHTAIRESDELFNTLVQRAFRSEL